MLFFDTYTKPSECVDIITPGTLEARVRRTSASRAPAAKRSDVRRIKSTHKGSFVLLYTQPEISLNYCIIA